MSEILDTVPAVDAQWLIYKKGRGFYRPGANDYTVLFREAGRFTKSQADAERQNEPASIRISLAPAVTSPAPEVPGEEARELPASIWARAIETWLTAEKAVYQEHSLGRGPILRKGLAHAEACKIFAAARVYRPAPPKEGQPA